MALTQVRQDIISQCRWGVENTASIHYDQVRPTPNMAWKAHRLPITTDCSGSLTAIYAAAGAPDPNGWDYNGQGNTGSLYANAEHVSMDTLEPGDFIICFKGSESEHVYLVVATIAGNNYKLFTHGEESTPAYETLAEVASYWASVGHMQGCRTLPLVPTYKWAVMTGNKVLARTSHPVRWAMRHPRSFRRHQWVRFRRDVI